MHDVKRYLMHVRDESRFEAGVDAAAGDDDVDLSGCATGATPSGSRPRAFPAGLFVRMARWASRR